MEQTIEQQAMKALQEFAKENGRTWKAKLRSLWNSGKDEAGLRLARNIYGPSGLDRFKLCDDGVLRLKVNKEEFGQQS
jgi:hypothetical protein